MANGPHHGRGHFISKLHPLLLQDHSDVFFSRIVIHGNKFPELRVPTEFESTTLQPYKRTCLKYKLLLNQNIFSQKEILELKYIMLSYKDGPILLYATNGILI
jgi:hypothetical protein